MIGSHHDRRGIALVCAATASLLLLVVADASAYREPAEHQQTGGRPPGAARDGAAAKRGKVARRNRRTRAARTASSPAASTASRPARPARARRARAASKARRSNPRVQITLDAGVTLVDVAHTYHVPVARIMSANRIREPRSIHAGRKLVIPGATKVRPLRRRPVCKSPAVSFLRVATDERANVVLTRCNGRPDPAGVERLSRLARSLRASASLDLDPRLAQMLQKVAVRFPRRRLEVISGYRPHPPGREGVSNHTKGRAIDFRIEGISNEVLRDFCRATFDDAGVGYYPNSVFVHLDVRTRGSGKAFWVDYSRPGERPRYGPLRPEHAADPHELADLDTAPRRRARPHRSRRRTRL